MIRERKRIQGIVGASGIVICLALSGGLRATDFIRGDFNSDGKVSISDAFFITAYLFVGATPWDYVLTGDADDSGRLNLTDAVSLLNYVVQRHGAPPAPFQTPGPDPTANNDPLLSCATYGGGSPLEDASAKIEILDAVAEGGTNGEAVITVRISHSTVASAYTGRILVDTSAIGSVIGRPEDLTGTLKGNGFDDARIDSGRLSFGYMASLTGAGSPWLQPEQDKDALKITVCLKDGSPAGDYPLTFSAGELTDLDSGRAISAQLVSGTLTILTDVAEGSGCDATQGCTDSAPGVGDPSDFHIAYSLGDAIGRPGSPVEMLFNIHADADVQGYSLSVDFDEEVLQAVDVVPVFKAAPGHDGFQKFDMNNKSEHTGSAGIDEGFIVGAMVFSLFDSCHNMPANKDNEALKFKFLVNPDTTVESTEVKFLDGGKGSGEPVRNTATAFGKAMLPELAGSFVFFNGVIGVQPDITTFVRGDSDGNLKLELNDAVRTLGYLFKGTQEPACFDAADANDDGTINIADPVGTLTFLYVGHGTIPPPYPNAGEDPTKDSMGCLIGP